MQGNTKYNRKLSHKVESYSTRYHYVFSRNRNTTKRHHNKMARQDCKNYLRQF